MTVPIPSINWMQHLQNNHENYQQFHGLELKYASLTKFAFDDFFFYQVNCL